MQSPPTTRISRGVRIDLDAGDELHRWRDRPRVTGLAIAARGVVVGQSEHGHAAGRGRSKELCGLEQPYRAPLWAWQVDRRGPGRYDGCASVSVVTAGDAAAARPWLRGQRQASTSRWIRSMASARPVAGSMSIWLALKTTAPSPYLEPRRQRVRSVAGRSAVRTRSRSRWAGHPRSVWYAVPPGRMRSSPVTMCVWVPTTALTRPSR